MYYEYWGLKRSPFDNVPDPTMYVESHASVENTIAETLFAIEEGNEAVAVIVGDVGLGKTLSLRLVLDSLDQTRYRIAFVTNPDMSFVQLLREIVGQLTGTPCEVKNRVDLLEIFNKLLFETADQGRKTLIIIDEANALSAPNLESLRLLTNMQDDQKNLLTIVLAGQMEFAKRLEHPNRANLFQRIGTYNRLEKIGSAELVRDYVETRIRLAGGSRQVFTDEAYPVIWEYSDYGTPRLINKICKLCLKAGETNRFDMIHGEIVRQIGERFQKLTGPALQKRRPRTRPSPEKAVEKDEPAAMETAAPEEAYTGEPIPSEVLSEVCVPQNHALEESESVAFPWSDALQEPVYDQAAGEVAPAAGEALSQAEAESFAPPEPQTLHDEDAERVAGEEAAPSMETAVPVDEGATPSLEAAVPREPEEPPGFDESELRPENAGWKRPTADTPAHYEARQPDFLDDTDEILEEARIGKFKIRIGIPVQLIRQARQSTRENRLKMAGGLAAQTLQKYPQLTFSTSADPVAVWSEIRNFILTTLEGTGETQQEIQ
jgi:general secretion pathway protein A